MDLGDNEWIVLTGGTGFVGGALLRRLLADGHRVRVISRGSAQPAASPQGTARLEWFAGDIRERSSIERAFDGARYVFHAAALVNSTAPYREFERANIVATRNVCELARAAGVRRLVHVGTADVFGIPAPGEIISERTPYRPWSEPYADTKIGATQAVHEFHGSGMECATIHPGYIYGPGDRHFVPSLIRQMRDGFFPLWGPRDAKVNLIHVDDLVDALLLAASSPTARDEEFLILDEGQTTLDGICRVIARELSIAHRPVWLPYPVMMGLARATVKLTDMGVMSRPMLSTTDVKSFGFAFRFSTEKARTVLGWTPQISFAHGMPSAVRAAASETV